MGNACGLKALVAVALLAAVSPLRGALGASPTTCYLVDGRVRVALTPGPEPTAGDLWWVDTVSGASGDARFRRRGSELVVEWEPGLVGEARLLPDLAIVFSLAPWPGRGQGTWLGVSLD
jgi:hypothetical protein